MSTNKGEVTAVGNAPQNLWRKENIKRFCFTYALMGGAWLETKAFLTSNGYETERNWFSEGQIESLLGEGEFGRLVRKHGWMTGCWIDV